MSAAHGLEVDVSRGSIDLLLLVSLTAVQYEVAARRW